MPAEKAWPRPVHCQLLALIADTIDHLAGHLDHRPGLLDARLQHQIDRLEHQRAGFLHVLNWAGFLGLSGGRLLLRFRLRRLDIADVVGRDAEALLLKRRDHFGRGRRRVGGEIRHNRRGLADLLIGRLTLGCQQLAGAGGGVAADLA